MTEEEERKLRDELSAAKFSSAYLYLAVDALGHLATVLPRAQIATLAGQPDADALQSEVMTLTNQLQDAMIEARKYIWGMEEGADE